MFCNLLSSIQYGTKRKSIDDDKSVAENSRHRIKMYIFVCVCVVWVGEKKNVCVCEECVSRAKFKHKKKNYTDPFISIIHGAEGSMRRREITDSVNSKR